ncbi:rubrerythrin family protein [Chroococcidiopsis sp. CCALA 051]|jgi:rubrerythrin|uniref:rubrerythrin family protein n=1 Tax=unclassified Chroococcidiopsis TaxID=2646205 RepID=UPI000D0D6A93|nr:MULTISPECIES: rubrerythrin family protein [unclassified Chroococcidiopsis]MBE9015569.1 ferritin-like domain-containing protein [Chroococcidiopsidales cyanobacterium LEGE 13417]PSM48744.1 rubrerythrin family protein [Chroococcidiopsis sp. CCALA 051]URD47955.1 ferritin-like domain-containing protein [Chroococcidiopsis sp. CCNUC1]
MNFLTYVLHVVGSGAIAYYTARQIRDPLTRPNTLAGFQLAESGSVPFLTKLSQRAGVEGDEWLAEKLAKHAADETRHGQIFAHALKQLNKQVIDFKREREKTPEEKPKEQQRSPFFDAFFKGYSPEQLKPENMEWNVFLASTYILELDASKDFVRMANVLPEDEPTSRNLKKSLLSVAQDETGHANYLYEAMMRRMPANQVQQLVDEWRTRKVNALIAFTSNMLQGKDKPRSLVTEGAPAETPADSQPQELAAV